MELIFSNFQKYRKSQYQIEILKIGEFLWV
jgi:hypothetical protein